MIIWVRSDKFISPYYRRFHMDTTDGVHLRDDCEAAAHIQQLSRPNTKLEEDKKELKEQLLKMSLFIDTLTTQGQVAVVKSALCGIKPNVTAVRAREAMMMSTSLVPTAESAKEPNNKNVEKQRRFFSTKRRKPAASSTTLAKPSNVERKKIQLAYILQPQSVGL